MNDTNNNLYVVNTADGSGDVGLLNFALRFKQLMMLYESAAKCVETQLGIMKDEYTVKGVHVPIQTVTSRIKQPKSITQKLKRRGSPLSIDSIVKELNDIAGVRIICPYIADVYSVRKQLIENTPMKLVKEKDYIQSPKPNGYRSLHLIMDVPVALSDGVKTVRCEIQLRTISMDSWATLEHSMRYKKELPENAGTDYELYRCAEMMFESDVKMQEIADELGVFDAHEEQSLLMTSGTQSAKH